MVQEKEKLKIYISADLEGVTGVIHPEQLYQDGFFYKEALMRWAQEINSVVSGVKEAGADYIVINDAHNHMRNLNNSMIPNAILISGWQKPFSMMSGIEKGFDACIFVGYHAMAGSKSVLSHTYRPKIIKQVLLNKVAVGEFGLNAVLAGVFNIPVILVSGDEEVCYEAQNFLHHGQVLTVETKRAFSRYAAMSFPLEVNLRNLKETALQAVKAKEKWKIYKMPAPYTISITFNEPNHADAAELIPGVNRTGDTQIEFTHQLYPTVFKCFLAICTLAATREEVIT